MERTRRPPHQLVRIVKWEGRLVIQGMDKWYFFWRDPYHLLLTIPWSGFIVLI